MLIAGDNADSFFGLENAVDCAETVATDYHLLAGPGLDVSQPFGVAAEPGHDNDFGFGRAVLHDFQHRLAP